MSDALLEIPDDLRQQAQRCRSLARQTIDPKVVHTLLDLADELDARAEVAEERAATE